MRSLLSTLAFVALVAACLAPGAAAASGISPGRLPGLGTVPWERLQGQKGRWVRYRVTSPQAPEPSYLTLSVVDVEPKRHRLWVEVRISGQVGPAAPGVVSKLLLAPGEGGAMSTERMIVQFGGGAPVELDLSTVPPDDDAGPGDETQTAAACAAPESATCRERAGGPTVHTRPAEAVMTPMGTLQAVPIEVRTSEGLLFSYLVSDRVPVTGLVVADLGMRGRMELDAVGDDARSTVGEPTRKVSNDELAGALAAGSPAMGAMRRVGRPVDPREAEGKGAP